MTTNDEIQSKMITLEAKIDEYSSFVESVYDINTRMASHTPSDIVLKNAQIVPNYAKFLKESEDAREDFANQFKEEIKEEIKEEPTSNEDQYQVGDIILTLRDDNIEPSWARCQGNSVAKGVYPKLEAMLETSDDLEPLTGSLLTVPLATNANDTFTYTSSYDAVEQIYRLYKIVGTQAHLVFTGLKGQVFKIGNSGKRLFYKKDASTVEIWKKQSDESYEYESKVTNFTADILTALFSEDDDFFIASGNLGHSYVYDYTIQNYKKIQGPTASLSNTTIIRNTIWGLYGGNICSMIVPSAVDSKIMEPVPRLGGGNLSSISRYGGFLFFRASSSGTSFVRKIDDMGNVQGGTVASVAGDNMKFRGKNILTYESSKYWINKPPYVSKTEITSDEYAFNYTKSEKVFYKQNDLYVAKDYVLPNIPSDYGRYIIKTGE